MKQTFYCIALRVWGVSTCIVYNTLEDFTDGISGIYGILKAPSQIDTCSIRACDEGEAFSTAVEYFNDNGWNIIIPEEVKMGE